MKEITPVDILEHAKKLIPTEDKWTQGAYARSDKARIMRIDNPRVDKHCMTGAIYGSAIELHQGNRSDFDLDSWASACYYGIPAELSPAIQGAFEALRKVVGGFVVEHGNGIESQTLDEISADIGNIAHFNDAPTTRHSDVIEAYDDAINYLEAQSTE